MTVDVNEAKDGGILRDRYGREQLVAVDKHAAPSITDLPIPDGYTDADGRRQIVLATPGGVSMSVLSEQPLHVEAGEFESLRTGDDWTASFVAALNKSLPNAVSDANKGQTVKIGPRIYEVGDLQFAQSFQKIQGSGWGSSLRAKAGAAYVVIAAGMKGTKLEDLTIDGRSRASKGIKWTGAGGVASENQSLERVRVTQCSTGLDIVAGSPDQVDKNSVRESHFASNTYHMDVNSINAQELLLQSVDLYDAITTAIRLYNGSLTWLSGQVQTAPTFLDLLGSTIEWVNLQDVITEGCVTAIDGDTFWPVDHVKTEHCVLQASGDTVKMGVNNAKLISELTRFLNGGFAPTGTDQMFEEHDCRFLAGATLTKTGATQFRHRKWDANGLQFLGSEFTAVPVNSGRTPIVAKSVSGQTADLIQTQDDLGTPQLGIIPQGGGIRFYGTMTAASAPNNTIFRDSADNVIKKKDNAGTVTAI